MPYDIQQICENGHQATDRYGRDPEARKNYCQACGARTITKCEHCKADIRGRHYDDLGYDRHVPPGVPSHCLNCGKPYPWTERKRAKAKAVRNREVLTAKLGSDIFIVHGHDEGAKQTVARFIEKLDLKPIVLHEQADKGRTVIEKFEDHSNVGFAIVLLTPDDIGGPINNKEKQEPRARQNVMFELGFFIGKLGRDRVCALYKGDVEIPSDYEGVLHKPMEGDWQLSLAKEIKAAGIPVDLNKAM